MANNTYERDGVKYPRVTSIIAQLDKPGLLQWAVDCAVKELKKLKPEAEQPFVPAPNEIWVHLGDETFERMSSAYKRESDEAKEIGSLVHRLIHKNLMNEPIMDFETAASDEIRNAILAFFEWRNIHQVKVILSELTIYEDKGRFKYAGTVDFLGYVHYKGRPRLLVVDFKTDKRLYPTTKMQIAAYWHRLNKDNPKIYGGACVRLDKDAQKFEMKVWKKQELRKEYSKFRLLCEFWHRNHKQQEVSPDAT